MLKKKLGLFLSINFLIFLNFCTYGLPVTYFPNVAKNRGILDYLIGIIFSMYPVFSFICGFLASKLTGKMGRKATIISSQIALAIGTLLFGVTHFVSQNWLFVVIALIGRSLQGAAIGTFMTIAFAYIPEIWPTEIDRRMVFLELALNMGIGLGPVVGSVFYMFFGYFYVFVFPSVIIFFFGIILPYFVFIESKLDRPHDIKISETFSHKEIVYLFFTVMIALTSFTMIMPEFENKMIEMGQTPEIASYLFGFNLLTYLVVCLFMICYPVQNKQGLFFISAIVNCIGLWCWSVDSVVVLEQEPEMLLIGAGLLFNGIVKAWTIVPFMAECISILKKKFPMREDEGLNYMGSGLLNGSISLAEFVGPILGGALCDLFDFSRMAMIYSGVALVFLVLFGSHGDGARNFMKFFTSGSEKNKEYKEI